MHQPRRVDDRPPYDVADGLVAEAHTEHRHAALGERRDRRAEDPGVLGAAGAGRQQHGVGPAIERLVDGQLVVADHLRLGAELAEVLHEVVDEAVVAVDHQHPRPSPRSLAATTSACRTIARIPTLPARGAPEAQDHRPRDPQGHPPGPGARRPPRRAHRPDGPGAEASSRYTPPHPQEMKESPRWVPVLMFVSSAPRSSSSCCATWCATDTNSPVIVGLGLLLGGLFVATKWQ